MIGIIAALSKLIAANSVVVAVLINLIWKLSLQLLYYYNHQPAPAKVSSLIRRNYLVNEEPPFTEMCF